MKILVTSPILVVLASHIAQRWRHLAGTLAMTMCIVIVSGCGGGSTGGGGGDAVASFVRLMNDYRESVGCQRLNWNDRLAGVAQKHSDDMARRKYLAHTSPDGVTFVDRMRSSGFSQGAENIASGGFSGQSLLNIWLSSPTHRVNIENCSWTLHGVGQSGSFYTHDFSG